MALPHHNTTIQYTLHYKLWYKLEYKLWYKLEYKRELYAGSSGGSFERLLVLAGELGKMVSAQSNPQHFG